MDNLYYGHFSPPTNASRHVYIRVFITDTSISADSIPIVGRGLHSYPYQLKLSWFLGHMPQLSPLMCPKGAQVEL